MNGLLPAFSTHCPIALRHWARLHPSDFSTAQWPRRHQYLSFQSTQRPPFFSCLTSNTVARHGPPHSHAYIHSLSPPSTRRRFLIVLVTALLSPLSHSLLTPSALLAAPIPEGDALSTLQLARAACDDIDDLITNGKWDSVRTRLARPPIAQSRDVCGALAKKFAATDPDLRAAVVGLREDILSATRLLDTAVYANVFVGEDRQILGTKVDYDTPRVYLAQLKEALDALVEIGKG